MSTWWVSCQLKALPAFMMSCDINSLTWYDHMFGQIWVWWIVNEAFYWCHPMDQYLSCNIHVWDSKLANFYKEMSRGKCGPLPHISYVTIVKFGISYLQEFQYGNNQCETHCTLAILATRSLSPQNLDSDCEFVSSPEVTHWKLIIGSIICLYFT